ncbi:MAG: hypothetical protein OCC46_16730 [Pseudodesulfovibrio sp.]
MKKTLLLGAGFSYDFGMPLAAELTDVFYQPFTKFTVNKLSNVLSTQNPYGDDRPINKNAIKEGFSLLLKCKKNRDNYELFLSNLQDLTSGPNKSQSDRDSYNYLFSTFYNIIHTILSLYQITSYSLMYGINKQWFSEFYNILSDDETWAFTLNHDLYLECLAIDHGIPATYGDNDSIVFPVSNMEMSNTIDFTYSKRDLLDMQSPGYFNGENGLNIVKLHGGINELEYKDRSIICNPSLDVKTSLDLIRNFQKIESMCYFHEGMKIPSGKDRVICNAEGELDIAGKSMLTGGRKYSKTANFKKGEEKLKLLDDVLRTTDELTVIGYGFGDPHINFRISNAMVLNENLNIWTVSPNNSKTPEILEQFNYNHRVRKAHCGAAQWMQYCDSEKWNNEQSEALMDNQKFREIVKKSVLAGLNAKRPQR